MLCVRIITSRKPEEMTYTTLAQSAIMELESNCQELENVDLELAPIIELVEQRTGVNLRLYRETSVARRVAARLRMAGCRDYREYADLMVRKPEEAEKLLEYVTIKWSRFFRDQAVFDRLRDQILPELGARNNGRLAIWSAGCAKGEEPYSVALLTQTGAAKRPNEVVVYATDIDESALTVARTGIYPHGTLESVPSHVLQSCFVPHPGRSGPSYRVHGDVSAAVRFSRHDLLGGEVPAAAPFDLVLCRNVVIYFKSKAQVGVFDLLSFSLASGGYLCLGEAEQLPTSHFHLFETVDRRDRIYRKK